MHPSVLVKEQDKNWIYSCHIRNIYIYLNIASCKYLKVLKITMVQYIAVNWHKISNTDKKSSAKCEYIEINIKSM